MQLPEALYPWRRWLEWFAPEQLPLFVDLFGRLNPLLGPLRGLHQGGVPEPDGLGDLQRRGPYERLLSSEWLLADELPDEFLRRAVVGEHLFLAPQYRARQASRLMVVLFDVGPLQLGAARLVHLALLILLARRAEEAGAELRWGVVQQPARLHEFNSAGHLRQMLALRTYQAATEEHWQTWRDALAELKSVAGESWLVGQRLPPVDGHLCTQRVLVHPSLDGRGLGVQIQPGAARRVTLGQPDERLALQLLSGQFAGEQVSTGRLRGDVPRVALTLPPVISSSGNHIALRLLDEPGVAVIKLPGINQKKHLDVRRELWSNGGTALTVTFMGRVVGAVLSSPTELHFWKLAGLRTVAKPALEELQLPPGTASYLPAVALRSRSDGRLFLLDPRGRLAFWVMAIGGALSKSRIGVTQYLADDVLAMARVDGDVVAYVRRDEGRLYVHRVNAAGIVSSAHVIAAAQGVKRVLFAHGPLWRRGFGGCALLQEEAGRQKWRVVPARETSQAVLDITLDKGWKALGLLFEGDEQVYSLLLLGPNQQTVAVHSEGQQQVLFTTSQAISRWSFCPASGLLAVLTSARELLVYSAPRRTLCLQVFCDGSGQQNRDDGDA
ncbi:hypothetical protein QO207_27640 [Pseudomonas sp. CAN2814]|uniref:hypothetical protein n=1 Tax=Pseudomonas sp. CAN1 TaxID=3046726 RepID=UPI002648B67E|nr:hypothetical protein [Pseudomonas sp. CAN1]MDN6860380.1 hypothetical protein [Pseudomonas sp. CAN1]